MASVLSVFLYRPVGLRIPLPVNLLACFLSVRVRGIEWPGCYICVPFGD